MRIKPIALAATVAIAAALSVPATSQAQASSSPQFEIRHGPQGTGNYKGKRDRHEKRGPFKERKRKKPGWIHKR